MLEILLLTLLTVSACLVGTVTGFGSSTIMVPILVFFFPLTEVLILATIIHLFVDIWKMILFHTRPNWHIILTFGIAGAVLSIFGSQLAFETNATHLRIFGLVLILSVVLSTLEKHHQFHPSIKLAIAGGSLSGILAGIFGIGGPVRTLVLNSFNLSKANYIFASGAIGMFIDASRFSGYVLGGMQMRSQLWLSLLLLIPASLLGSKLGKKIVNHVSPAQFRLIVSAFLIIIGLRLTLFPQAH